MLRDRYRGWGINDKNRRPRQIRAARRHFTTRRALLQSPRIVELADDGSHMTEEPINPQDEHESLDPHMMLSNSAPGSPIAALLSLDPKIHEILNGLSYWCSAGARSWNTKDVYGGIHLGSTPVVHLRRGPIDKIKTGRDCYAAAMTLIQSRNLWSLLETIRHISEYRCLDWLDWLEGLPFDQCRIPWLLCEHAAQVLGQQHPITLVCSWAARGLPLEDLVSLSRSIFRILISSPSWPHWGNRFVYKQNEVMIRRYLGRAIVTQEQMLNAISAKQGLQQTEFDRYANFTELCANVVV